MALVLRPVLLLVLFLPLLVWSQTSITPVEVPPALLARIEVHTADELDGLLQRAEQLFDAGKVGSSVSNPIAFVLHGPEANSLLTKNYSAHKQLVDRAARLSAFKVVDIRVCKTWLGGEKLKVSQLPPFITFVPFGPAEERRLMEDQGYVYF